MNNTMMLLLLALGGWLLWQGMGQRGEPSGAVYEERILGKTPLAGTAANDAMGDAGREISQITGAVWIPGLGYFNPEDIGE